jgi:hypothetical protein
MKKNSGKQAVINFIGQHPGCSFQDIRRGTGLDSSVVNSSCGRCTVTDRLSVKVSAGATATP